MDLKENLLHGSESSIAEPVQTIREGLPRPRSGEFRALFEGNTPWHWGTMQSGGASGHRATIWNWNQQFARHSLTQQQKLMNETDTHTQHTQDSKTHTHAYIII